MRRSILAAFVLMASVMATEARSKAHAGIQAKNEPSVPTAHSVYPAQELREPRIEDETSTLTTYNIKDNEDTEFIEAWKQAKAGAVTFAGNLDYDLYQIEDNNNNLYAWSGWADVNARNDWLRSDYQEKLSDYCISNEVYATTRRFTRVL